MRYWLSRNRSTASPGSYVFVDTETLPEFSESEPGMEIHKLRLGCATRLRLEAGKVSRRKTIRFRTQDEFWSFLLASGHKRVPTWVFAHNVGFDTQILGFWQRVEAREFVFSDDDLGVGDIDPPDCPKCSWKGIAVTDDPPTVLSVKHSSGKRFIFVDTLNYWRVPLSRLGERLGYEKHPQPDYSESDETWWGYCERDVEILERAVLSLAEWVKEHDFGKFRFTAPSQAMAAFRHRFMEQRIEQHDECDVKKLERSCYYGGRLELRWKGLVKGPVYGLDVRSMYPYVMRDKPVPCMLDGFSGDASGETLEPHQLTGSYCAEVRIVTDAETYPVRCPLGTIWPIGDYWTALCGAELWRAVSSGHVVEVARWARFRCFPLFRDFVSTLYEMRMRYAASGDKIYADFCKLLLNSLYGKFGQKTPEWVSVSGGHSWEPFSQWVSVNADTGEIQEYRSLGRHLQKRVERDEHDKAFPAIAAYVTAYAREYLRELCVTAGWENVFYLVTDALFTNREGFERLSSAGYVGDDELGLLTIEAKADWAEFEALHHYRVGSKRKRGSRKKSARRVTDDTVEQLEFEGLAKYVTSKPREGVRVKSVRRTYAKGYDKGTVNADGSVSPLRIVRSLEDHRVGNTGREV